MDPAQRDSSVTRVMVRSMLNPHVVMCGSKDSVLKGISSSRVHSSFVNPGRGIPDPVPADTRQPIADDEPIRHGAGRIDHEVVAIAPVVERIDHDLDIVVGVGVAVPSHGRAEERVARTAQAANRDVECVLVVRQADLGLLRRRLARIRKGLNELTDEVLWPARRPRRVCHQS